MLVVAPEISSWDIADQNSFLSFEQSNYGGSPQKQTTMMIDPSVDTMKLVEEMEEDENQY